MLAQVLQFLGQGVVKGHRAGGLAHRQLQRRLDLRDVIALRGLAAQRRAVVVGVVVVRD